MAHVTRCTRCGTLAVKTNGDCEVCDTGERGWCLSCRTAFNRQGNSGLFCSTKCGDDYHSAPDVMMEDLL